MGSKRLTLKDIDQHLSQQDKEQFTLVPFSVGGSIVLVASSLWIHQLSGFAFWIICLFLLLCGLGLMAYARWMQVVFIKKG